MTGHQIRTHSPLPLLVLVGRVWSLHAHNYMHGHTLFPLSIKGPWGPIWSVPLYFFLAVSSYYPHKMCRFMFIYVRIVYIIMYIHICMCVRACVRACVCVCVCVCSCNNHLLIRNLIAPRTPDSISATLSVVPRM